MRATLVLVVEDDTLIASGIESALRAGGHACTLAPSGEEALAHLRRAAFDLVLVDLGLPGIDGFELLERMAGAGHRGATLVLTANDRTANRVRALNLGADDFLAKPFALEELLARVRALLRRTQSGEGPRYRFEGVAVDIEAGRAWLDGQPLELPRREWSALICLLESAGKPVAKQVLINALSTRDEAATPNSVEVYVSRLRARLEPAGIMIRAIRGYGYMLDARP